jgi:N-methylhydantoinase A/oxoprolinase/acetone carboxylase beta subunit
MRAGHRVQGPAIIEEPFTTIVLHPHQEAVLDRHGNYRIEL